MMRLSLSAGVGLGVGLLCVSAARGVETPAQLADPNTGQIPNPYFQEYYYGQITPGQPVLDQTIIGGLYPNQASVTWYSFTSDGKTPLSFDEYGSSFGFGGGAALTGGTYGEFAVYDSFGNFIAENKGAAIPSTGDSNVPAVIPAGAPAPPVRDTLRQPLDPTQPEYYYSSSQATWFNDNEQGLANINFIKNPQTNPLIASTDPSYNWNQYSILPAGTYFLAVAAYSTYFAGSPADASGITSYGSEYGVTNSTPYGFVDLAAGTGYYNLDERIAGDFNQDGVANLADLRLLRLQVAQYLPTQGIASSGYSNGAWVGLPSNTASPLTDLQQYDLTGNSRIDINDIKAWGNYTGQSTIVSLTWNNSPAASDPYNPSGPGDGVTWDIETSQNFNDTVGTDVYFDGDLVTFNDNNNGNYAVTLNSVVSPGSLTFSNSAGNYVISGTGSINGSTGLLKTGTASLTLSTVNTYTGGTNVSGGSLRLTVTGALPVNSSLIIGSGASVVAVNSSAGSKIVLQTSALSIAGASNAWTGLLDLNNNDLIAHNGSLGVITNQIKSGFAGGWHGTTGITSSAAAANPSHLTALGVIQNSTNGSPTGTALYTSFDGVPVTNSDVLIKYTYFGDANLDGAVNSSDYSRIDNGYLLHLTGWSNGDFNYDGVVNGSDYTLIDNAFNMQGAAISVEFASSTVPIATAAVPEPTVLSAGVIGGIALLVRRRRRTI
jgi:autotransporter-associated beta strand protein